MITEKLIADITVESSLEGLEEFLKPLKRFWIWADPDKIHFFQCTVQGSFFTERDKIVRKNFVLKL